MKQVKVEDAVGMVLAHDLTKIVPEVFKGPAFKKGHVIRAEDIEELKNIGKNHLWVVTLTEEQVHEDEAAHRIATAAVSEQLAVAAPAEGKSNIRAAVGGLLKVNRQGLDELNLLSNLALVTLHTDTIVQANQLVAAAKIIPLTMERSALEDAEKVCGRHQPLIDIKPFFPLKAGVVVTGSEVFYGRIQDRFGAVLTEKITHYGGEVLGLEYAPDDPEAIYRLITGMIEKGAEVVLISGGMAVDADDVTPQAITKAATEVISYGLPVLPGSMCMIAFRGPVPVIGVPACAMFNHTTVLDLILPKIMARERLIRSELLAWAHGGMCRNCEVCHYPICSFGK